MTDIINYFLTIIVIPHFCWALYLTALSFASFFFRKKSAYVRGSYKIVVVVPAYNEEKVIDHTLSSLKTLDYPADDYQVVVIADNCDDNTEQIARDAGVEVVTRTDSNKLGKGHALDWFLRSHNDRYSSFDAVAIVDADTFVHPNFLKEIASSLAVPGVKVVQGYYGISNVFESKRSALGAAAFHVMHHTRQAGRLRLRGSAGLVGNGMAFRTEILKRYGWPARSIVEDLEFTLHLMLAGVGIDYNPDAMVFADVPTGQTEAISQQVRWEGGRFFLVRRWFFPLLRRFYSTGKMRYFGMLLDLLTPPLTIIASVLFLLLIFTAIFLPQLLILVIFSWLAIFFCAVAGQIQRKSPDVVWKAVFWAPVYLFQKLSVYARLLKHGTPKKWRDVRRKGGL